MNVGELHPIQSSIGRVYAKRWPGPHQAFPATRVDGLTVKTEVDPRKDLGSVFDQGRIGSCTANATSKCFQYDAITAGHDPGLLSRTWIYHFEKALEGTLGQGDTGAVGHDAFTVARHGIPSERMYAYSENIEVVDRKPPPCEPRAYYLSRPVKSVPQSTEAIKKVLSNGQTIAFGFVVYESFEDSSWWAGGEMPIPGPNEGVLGGHEILGVGYLKEYPGFLLCLNSWGVGFGLGGYFLMPFSFFTNTTQVSDLRTIVRPAS